MTKIVQIITLLGLACGSLLASADEIDLQPQHPSRHVVVKGDTLWGISAKFLKNPWQWPQIWQLNRSQIKNPHWIYPGDVIVLDTSSGKPVLRIVRDEVKLEPEAIITPIAAEAIPPIQPNVIQAFLNKPMLISKEDLAAAPRIVAAQEDRAIISPGTRIYVKNLPATAASEWAVFHEGDTVKDPKSGEVLGIEALYLGEAKLVKHGDPAVMDVIRASEEIAVKDKLIAVQESLSQPYIPHAPDNKIEGQIAKIASGVAETGAGRVVLLNRGASDGLENGHVLSILRPGDAINDPESTDAKHPVKITLPSEPIGLVMVFKTFPKLSYALVMRTSRSVQVNDIVQTP